MNSVRTTVLTALLFCALPLCAATYTVTNTNATGAGSLDAAITSANSDVAADTIQFAIPGAGVHTIIPTGSYVISTEIIVDAATQPGYAGAPLIEIDGNTSVADLFVVMSEATIRGFSLTGYQSTAIVIGPAAGDTVISANYIGLEPNGTTADGAVVGVRVADNASSGETHLIGGSTVADRNVIAGNNFGIEVANATTALVSVQGNFIGTTAAGTATAANGTGIRIQTYNAVKVGTVASNTIAFNGVGTEVLDGPAEILSNSFFSNTTGIDIANTGNPNELPPTLTSAVSNATSTRITGSLAVPLEPGTLYRLQFFSNPVSEDQGRTFIGETTVTTDGSGNASFDVTFPVAVTAGQFVTATATNTPQAETSEFAQDIVVTAAVANLTLSKTTTSTTVTTGQTISYTITVTNNGPDPATGVTITDTIPANTSFVSATPTQGSCTGTTTVTCSIGTLANGASATVTLQVQAASPGSAVNSASATSNESDPDGANATAPAVTVAATANLSVTKTTSDTTVAVGETIDYSITVTNNGPDTATGVTITDTIPANTTFVSATPSQGSCSGTTTVTCTIGTLSNGSSATVTLQLVATGPGSTVNSASAAANETDPDGAAGSAPAVTVTGAALAPVPTLSVWAMIVMGLAIAFVAMRARL